MNITKKNFNDYLNIALSLSDMERFESATRIAHELWDRSFGMDIQDSDDIDLGLTVRLLTHCEWRDCQSSRSMELLTEILNNNDYWSDNFIADNQDETGAWILLQKAFAYAMLAENHEAGQIQDIYVDRAITYIDKSIELYEKLGKEDSEFRELSFVSKSKKARILMQKSNSEARRYTISLLAESLLAENLPDGLMDDLMEIYQETTDFLFDNFFEQSDLAAISSTENVSNDVKEDVTNHVLQDMAVRDNPDEFWFLFTHIESPENRQKLLLVEDIRDAALYDLTDIRWVFTLDRIPADIEFEEEKPCAGTYTLDEHNYSKYHLFCNG